MTGVRHCPQVDVRFGLAMLMVMLLFPATVSAQAQKAPGAGQAKSSPAALTAYTDAARFQNNMAYELAAEEWARFLDRFGDDPLAARAQHYRGVCLMQLKRYKDASIAFLAVVTNHPKFELLEETYLNLGWCQYSLGQAGDENAYAQAIETFDKLETQFPKGKSVDQALFFKAEAEYALGKKKEAAVTYGKLVTGHADSKLRADGLYAMGVTLEELDQWKHAIKAYEMFLKDYAQDDLASEVRMRLAESVLNDGDVKAAETMFAEVANLAGFAAADHALLRQAYCAEQLGKDAEAAQLYQDLITRFPNSASVPSATLSAAKCLYRANQLEEAGKWFDRVLDSEAPGQVEAAHWRCRIFLQTNQGEAALKLADKILAAAPEDAFVANLRLDRADALYQSEGRQAEALAEYRAIAEEYPQHQVAPVALYNSAFGAMELKQYESAIELAGRFLAGHPDHSLTPDVRYVVAECKIQTQSYDEAAAIYRQLLDSASDHPESPLWRVRYALVLYLQEKYQETIDLLAPLVDQLQVPAVKAEAAYLIGVSHFQRQEYEAAAAALRKSLSTDASWPQADETMLYYARAQRQLNQLNEAVGSLESLLDSYGDSALLDQVYYHLGEFRYAGDQFPAAITAYDRVIQKYGSSAYVPLALYGKGWSEMKLTQFDNAIATFTTLLDKYPDYALKNEALFARGMCYRQADKFAEAIADINQYLNGDLQPAQRADALYERGLAEALGKQFAQAVATFNELLKEHPQYANQDQVLYELGWAYKSLPDPEAATKAFARLAAEHADSSFAAEANFHVGETAYAANDYAAAATAYQQAARGGNPVVREKALYKLGWSQFQLKQYAAALKQFESLLGDYGDGQLAADAWFMKAECLFRSEDYEQAMPAYREAIGREASSPQIAVLRQLHAAQAAGQLGKWQESLDLLDRLIAQYPESGYLAEAYFERGQAKLKLGKAQEAIEDYRQASEQSRGVVGVRALVMIGEIEFQQKQYGDAIKDFQRAMFRAVPQETPQELLDWQAKAGFEAGRCSEAQIAGAPSATLRAKHIADAKKFYQYVVQTHAQHELAATAKERLAELARLRP